VNLRTALRNARAGSTGLVVSRAASPELWRACNGIAGVAEAPVLAGRTVWEAIPGGAVVAETPNWWGRIEPIPEGRRHWVLDRRSGEAHLRATPCDTEPVGWAERIAALRACVRAAGQVRGVGAAHGDPEAPWAIVLLPVAPEAVAERCGTTGVTGVAALAPRMPELPGGLRIEAGVDAGSEWCAAVVASIRHVLERSGAV
jgi:hypothetical protein